MTVSAVRNSYQHAPQICDVRVYRAPREEVFAAAAAPTQLSWVLDPRLRQGRLRLTEGLTPASLDMQLTCALGAGRTETPNPLRIQQDLDPTGTIGPVPTPDGWQRWDVVKLALAPNSGSPAGAEEVLFVGYLVEWAEDLATGVVTMSWFDARLLMAWVILRGAWWWDETGETRVWIEDFLPEFNPRGKANLYRYWDQHPRKLAFVDDGAASASPWQRGIAWNYLRRLYNVEPPPNMIDTRFWLDWPEASAEGYASGLFGGDDSAVPDLGQAGHALAGMVDSLVSRRGDLSWTLGYDGASGRARPVLFGTGSGSLQTGQRRISFRRGTSQAGVSSAQAEVVGGRLRHTAARTATVLRGFGARKRFDLSFDTTGTTLEQGWTAADQAAWIALDDDERARKYPHVFTRFVVPTGTRWADVFGWAANLVRVRQAESELASLDGVLPGLRVRLLAWRRVSGGDWEPVPERLQPRPCRGALGIEFPQDAREEVEIVPDAGEQWFTWNGNDTSPVVNHIRVTLCVEADERLTQANGGVIPGWPVIEKALVDEDYAYEARNNAWLNVDGAGLVTASGVGTGDPEDGGATLMGYEGDDVIRDDSGKLLDALTRLLSQRLRTSVEGPVKLKGLRAIRPGDFVDRLVADGPLGTRPDYVIGAPVRSVDLDIVEQEPTTTVEIAGV